MPTPSGSAAPGLFEGVSEILKQHFGAAHTRTRTAALALSSEKAFDGRVLVRSLFDQLDANWSSILRSKPRGSPENFRWWLPQVACAPHNRSAEVTLERALIRACVAAGRKDWSNQVPLISGIAGPTAYKRWAIDLVRKSGEGAFEFVELKFASDTPLFAAIEILQYGLLWLLSRRDREALGYLGRPILEASSIELSILAPRAFYRGFQLDELVSAIDLGLAEVGKPFGVSMGFRQRAFPDRFQWPQPYSDRELVDLLDRREPA